MGFDVLDTTFADFCMHKQLENGQDSQKLQLHLIAKHLLNSLND